MFLNLETHPKNSTAIVDDSKEPVSFGELIERSNRFYDFIKKRTLIFILADNSVESFVAYYSCLNNQVVPLLLNYRIDAGLLKILIETYQPEFLFVPKSRMNELYCFFVKDFKEFVLVKSIYPEVPLNHHLALLLPTSGSTGSPKLVRHSQRNLEFSASSVSQLFFTNPEDSAIVLLPMYYTMGLSVINSHLKAGAKVVLTNLSLTDREFWNIMREERVTVFTGVPYSYEILDKLRFSRMNLPDLKIITQGGGKLKDGLFDKFVLISQEKGIKFIPTYGQTEGSARMSFLAHDKILEKKGSIGKGIPGGYLGVLNELGEEILETDIQVEGEMIYKGENVTLGYAASKEDLLKGDDNRGYLITGDIVRRDEEGYYFVIGRKKRFLKIFGLRVSLDEIESMIKSHFDVECVCSGSDDELIIATDNPTNQKEIKDFIATKTGLFQGVIQMIYKADFKRSATGKIDLNQI